MKPTQNKIGYSIRPLPKRSSRNADSYDSGLVKLVLLSLSGLVLGMFIMWVKEGGVK